MISPDTQHNIPDIVVADHGAIRAAPTGLCAYAPLLEPLLSDQADMVFAASPDARPPFLQAMANRTLSRLCHIDLSHVHIECLAFRDSFGRSIPVRSHGFAIQTELAIKFAKRRARLTTVPIAFTPARANQIRLKATLATWLSICRWFATSDIYTDKAAAMLAAMEHAPRFNRWMAATLKPFLGDRVLEIGGGIGNLTRLLCAGRTCYVVSDIDTHHLAQLKSEMRLQSNVSVVRCDLQNIADFEPFRTAMDTAICINVLEHIADDLQGLRNLHSALVPGGRAIVLVPQGENVYGTMDETLGHYRRYAKADLASRMRQAGFRVEHVIEFNRITYPGWFFNGRVLRRHNVSRVQLWLFDLLVPLWKRIDALLPWPPASLIAIGIRDDHAT